MHENLIEFHCRSDLLEVLPHPIPAGKNLPQWFRAMPAMMGAGASGEVETVKNCMPFFEAMTCGYLLPLLADMRFSTNAGKLRVEIVGFDLPLVDFHAGDQFPGAPFESTPIVKFHTP